MELLENALKISPDNAACRFYRARLLYEMHDYAQCLEELNDLKLIAHDEAQVCRRIRFHTWMELFDFHF